MSNAFPLAISIAAAIISLGSLWMGHLAPFKLTIAAGSLQIRIASFGDESRGRKWYIPQVAIPVSFANAGARAGRVLGLRIFVEYPELPIVSAHEVFTWHSEVDFPTFERTFHSRLQWIEEAVLSSAAPFIMLPKSTVAKHLVFDARWDDAVIQSVVNMHLEVYTDRSRKWTRVESWQISLNRIYWSELAEVGNSFVYPPRSMPLTTRTVYPKNLHDFTRGKGDIPVGGLKAGASIELRSGDACGGDENIDDERVSSDSEG
ncbi:hypothetical protein [Microbispora bryophytorum]|uniref:hypothetical protein n=1 Tax=Microbispora bryophytorum TaxID=1460882 RepID=UPI0033EBB0A6